MSTGASLVENARISAANLGSAQFVHFAGRRFLNRCAPPAQPYRLYSKYSQYPLWLRPRTSDIDVYDQIFRYREYRCLDHVRDVDLIIDCGANVGFSSAYLLTRFPGSRLIAIEPDVGNFAALERNLAPYSGRVSAHCTGVWSHSCGLVMSSEPFGDGREWARTVREAQPGETPTMTGIDIGALLRSSGRRRIGILKVDIEGCEREVFRSGSCQWLDCVDNIVIELHGQDCQRVFSEAIAGQGFEISTCDELTVCVRRSLH